MLNVEKVVRVLGYIMYTILWSPIIIVGLVLVPIVYIAWGIRSGRRLKDIVTDLIRAHKSAVEHDINFIKTGEW